MPNTPNQGLPYPPPTGVAPDVPYYMQQLAEAVDAKLEEALGPWTSYTPSLSGWTLGNAAVNARYKRIGDTVVGYCGIVWGSTSTFAGTLLVGLPVPVRPATEQGMAMGTLYVYDTSAGSSSRQPGTVVYDAADHVFFVPTTTPAGSRTVASAVPFTWAAGDQLKFHFTYEAA